MMNSSTSRPRDTEYLSFLQTLVSQESAQLQERTESHKETEAGLNTITEEEPTVNSQAQKGAVKMQETHVSTSSGNNHGRRNEDDHVWKDFYSDEDLKEKDKKEKEEAHSSAKIQSSENVKVREEARSRPAMRIATSTESERIAEPAQDKGIKKRKRQLFKQTTQHQTSEPTTLGGSQPNLDHSGSGDHYSNQMETMSETDYRGGQRLSRRKQAARPRCAGPEPVGDILQQKYQELQALLVAPFSYSDQQPGHQFMRLPGMSSLSLGNISAKDRQTRQAFVEMNKENSENGYAVLRHVQITNQVTNRPRTAKNPRRQQGIPLSSDKETEVTQLVNIKNKVLNISGGSSKSFKVKSKRKVRRSISDGSTTSSALCLTQSDVNDALRDNSDPNSNKKCRSRSRTRSYSPGREAIPVLNTDLRKSSNPALRQWLRKKNKELRKKKSEDRKKAREERAVQQEKAKMKEELFKDSSEKVKEWMKKKKEEAWRKAKEERRILREEEKILSERLQRQLQYSDVFRVRSIEKPPSVHTCQNTRAYIPIINTESTEGDKFSNKKSTEKESTEASESLTPHPPPTSKLIYRRPVSGRVQLMFPPQGQIEGTKKTESERRLLERKLAEEKARNIRMSYDQWLFKKREEDNAKRKDMANKMAMTKSDPELEKAILILAKRRTEGILRGKKNMPEINEPTNTIVGEGNFGSQRKEESNTSQKLEISGSQTLITLRPSTAKPISDARFSKFPRRSKSANLRVEALIDADKIASNAEIHPFRLPFPPNKGVPRHVAAKQRKLFASSVFENTNANQAKSEPQENEISQTADVASGEEHQNEFVGSSSEGEKDTEHDKGQQLVSDSVPQAADKREGQEKSFFVTEGNLGEPTLENSGDFLQTDGDFPKTTGDFGEEFSHMSGEFSQSIEESLQVTNDSFEEDEESTHIAGDSPDLASCTHEDIQAMQDNEATSNDVHLLEEQKEDIAESV